MTAETLASARRTFTLTVLGRTLEHLGVQMYKRRETAIAELVANSWDADAKNVYIEVPDRTNYDVFESAIKITDDGCGMLPDDIQNEYLVVGRNRRQSGPDEVGGRPVMGRKGIGKLAGFGIASRMTVVTWKDSTATEFQLDIANLKKQDGEAGPVEIQGGSATPPQSTPSGTRLILEGLKHKTPVDIDKLCEALARRFSRRVRGEMRIFVNSRELSEPDIELEARFPEEDLTSEELSDGNTVRYYYAYSAAVIRSPEMRGFTIYVRGKTAQAPPFFFNVEGTASGQHGTRYVTGAIDADFLDDGSDEESDLISTDRQEIDWEHERVAALRIWGEELSRRILREWSNRKGEQLTALVLENQDLNLRVSSLDETSQGQIRRFLEILGQAEPSPERAMELADALVRAYEFRQFHDVVAEIEDASDDPERLQRLLHYLWEWKVLESRAVLEIIKGRLEIVEKFHSMIVNDLPETAPAVGADNMHDLIGGYPWLLRPDWQVLAEERTVSKQLGEWNVQDVAEEDARLRYDFLALTDESILVVVEIKRSGHAVTLEDLQRLERYKERLSKAHDKKLHMVLVYGGTLDVSEDQQRIWKQSNDREVIRWSEVYERTRRHYEHYRAVLESDTAHADFARKEAEVARTRGVLVSGTAYRGPEERKLGLGEQDADLGGPKKA